MTVRQLIDAIDSGKTLEIESTFEALMADKVATKLDAYRQEVSKNMFASQVAEEKKEDEGTEDLSEAASNSLAHHAVKMAAHHVDRDTDEDPHAQKKIEALHKKIEATHGKEVAHAIRKNAESESHHNVGSAAQPSDNTHHDFVKKHLGGAGSADHKAYVKKMKSSHMDSQSE
jgi:hypothetical protein